MRRLYSNTKRAVAPRWKGQVPINTQLCLESDIHGKHLLKMLSPIPTSQSPLPGSEQVIEQAFAYFRRSFYDTSPRPLLLTGAKGTGKTTAAHHVGQLLASDRNLLTGQTNHVSTQEAADPVSEPIYHDITRLDIDGRLSELKEKVSEWLEDTTRRRPALLILDSLEHLLHPQNEVSLSPHTWFSS